MQNTYLKIFLIAGEASGDNLGGKLMEALINISPIPVKFYGIGGENMTKFGLNSLFPLEELSIMGFFEILPNIINILKRIKETVQYIKYINPDVVITIDSPGFCFNVAKKLQNSNIKLIHYVAPSVWAYNPKRAIKMAKLYDYLLALLPFEPPYFVEAGLPCSFIGHPIVEDILPINNNFKTKYNIQSDEKVLCIMPGSRLGEIQRLLPIFCKAAKLLKQAIPKLRLIIITLPILKNKVEDIIDDYNLDVLIISQEEKLEALNASHIALVKSGTSTLEVAMAKLPMIVAYKINIFSAFLLKFLLRTRYVTLINIIENKEIIPEFLQNNCHPTLLADALKKLLLDNNLRQIQTNAIENILLKLGYKQTTTPSMKAAQIILNILMVYR